MIRNILLPIDYKSPLDLEKSADINSYIIDIGYRVYQSVLQQSHIKETDNNTQEELTKLRACLRDSYDRENSYLSEIKSMIITKNSSSMIGVVGESLVIEWIKDLFNNAEILDTSSVTASGDIHVRIGGKLLLLEIKNKLAITKSDIEKFVRDVGNNAQSINGALFISINTPCIPNKGDFSFEYVGDTPVIYLHVSE